MAVMVRVTEPPGDTLVPPVIWSVGTVPFAMVVWAELGLPTEYPVPEARAIVMVVSGCTVVVARVWTLTEASSAPAGRVTEVGGEITFSEPAVPPGTRFTVMSEVEVAVALIMKSAAWPADTWSATDWMVRVGVGSSTRTARGAVAPLARRTTDAVWVEGGPMIKPAVAWFPSS